MNRILRAWRASFVRRWHTNFDLCDTHDPNAAHQCRCVILLLQLFPDASRDLIVATITHDQGEVSVGDVSWTAKQASPELTEAVDRVEADERVSQGWPCIILDGDDRIKVNLVDRLDSYLWMLRHCPKLRFNQDWFELRQGIWAMARNLGVYEAVRRTVELSEERT